MRCIKNSFLLDSGITFTFISILIERICQAKL
jgi:hypothetical protein